MQAPSTTRLVPHPTATCIGRLGPTGIAMAKSCLWRNEQIQGETKGARNDRLRSSRGPFRVNRVTLTARRELLLFPDQRTSPTGCVRSEKCQKGDMRLISCRSKMRGKGLPARRLSTSLKTAFYAFTVRSHPNGQAV